MWKPVLLFSILSAVTVWLIVLTYPDDYLHIVACDVGQGDGILIFKKTTQIIIDGGPGNKMTKCLDRYLPFWDRTIEIVMNTHPQLDHYEGLIDIFKRYHVQYFFANSLESVALEYQVLKQEVGSNGSIVVNPRKGMHVIADQLQFEIINPTSELLTENNAPASNLDKSILGAFTSTTDPNEFSIVAKLSYKSFDGMFTGDASPIVEHTALENGLLTDVEFLKVPHHGSKNGLTEEFLDALTPEIAVISDGKKNRYGHPHKEILDMLRERKIQTLRTDQEGDVEVVSDGEKYWIEESK